MKKFLSITICGVTNAGKSTFVNKVCNNKVSIVSPKVQTTQNIIRGVFVDGDVQIVFVDTPGIFDSRSGYELEKRITKTAWSAIRDAGVILVLIDGIAGICHNTQKIMQDLERRGHEFIAVINKCDVITDDKKLKIGFELESNALVQEIFYISARNGKGLEHLISKLKSRAEEGEWHFAEDDSSDVLDRTFASEIVREKVFAFCKQEIPYNVSIMTESFDESDSDIIRIKMIITCKKDSQKGIIIGNGGKMIRQIRVEAQKELSIAFGRKTQIEIFVNVDENWQIQDDYYQYMKMS